MNRVTIVGCLHGDEIIGQKVIEELQKLTFKKDVSFLIANKEALEKKNRFISTDLNRSFPGKKGASDEEGLAFDILQKIKDSDLIIDIHATNSDFDKVAIVPDLSRERKELLKAVPIKKIALVTKQVFGGKELMNYSKLGVALDYGPDKTGDNYQIALEDIKQILLNLNFLDGQKNLMPEKELYRVQGLYKTEKEFKPNNNLREFEEIKEGDFLGQTRSGERVLAKENFYPLFLGKGSYQESLCLKATKEILSL